MRITKSDCRAVIASCQFRHIGTLDQGSCNVLLASGQEYRLVEVNGVVWYSVTKNMLLSCRGDDTTRDVAYFDGQSYRNALLCGRTNRNSQKFVIRAQRKSDLIEFAGVCPVRWVERERWKP